MISIIVAMADGNAIGYQQELLCHLPADLKHFKSITTGHPVIMGRKTFESLPNGALPNRKNIVLTHQKEIKYPNVTIVSTMQDAIAAADNDPEIFVIGGASVYRDALAFADKLYLTVIHHQFDEADTFFPAWDSEEWIEIAREDFKADEKNRFDYSFVTFQRKNNY